jgi:hypothetical protein
MSVNAVSGVAQAYQKSSQPPAAPSPGTTPFGQQLDDIGSSKTLAARGHQHHQGSASQAAASAPGSAGHAGSGTLGSLLALLS